MALSPLTRQRLLFAFLCLVWGLNWVAMKIGVTVVPPGIYSGARWTAAGIVLLAWRYFQGQSIGIRPSLRLRIVGLSVLLIPVNVFIMLYGLRYVSSGLASVLSSALTPIALLWFSVMMGQETFKAKQLTAMGVGVGGLLLLYGPKAFAGRLGVPEMLGSLGIILGNLAYCLGSVFSRRLMRMMSPALLAAQTNFIGGVVLLIVALAVEPGARDFVTGNWGLEAWVAWLFQVVAGSLGATVIYFFLVRDWGASRTGSYAFISPVIAVLAGMLLLGEQVDLLEAAGMGLMLVAAAMVLRG